ncbi:hydrophobic surface binding protein A-domain-containing protein [Aspergillus minisclerotigenes]|uniref:Hydrophobic surface binding protein A-domain-containing protein n=1 Tax=Aspergillus minisclerotigenes TaxID=656917 RepID=A0A5N6IL96_9EURO|nr:hydrophobic surface binding protein A-domain-containing protein [Aspergillus minisclerotigenes]
MVLIAKFLILALTAAATPILRRDAVKVQDDITQKIAPQINTLSNDVQHFPASGLTGALAIHSDLQSLVTTVNDATADIKSTGSLDTLSGTTILVDIQSLMPTFLATLTQIGAEAPAWGDIQGGPALILSDLRSLKTALDNFANALTSSEPLLLKAGALAIKTQIDGGLELQSPPTPYRTIGRSLAIYVAHVV